MIRLKPSHWIARALFYGTFLGTIAVIVAFSTEVPSERLRARAEKELNEVMNRRVTVGRAYFYLLGEARPAHVLGFNPEDSRF